MKKAVGTAIPCQTKGCRSVFHVRTANHPVDQQLRAAGWRMFDGKTVGGKQLYDVRCPTCSRPDTRARKAAGEIEGEERLAF